MGMETTLPQIDISQLANLSALPPPANQKSDFDAPAPGAEVIRVLYILTTSIALVAVAIRLYVRRFVCRQRIYWDDGACVAALVAAIAHTYILLKNLDYGLGKHMWNVRVTSFTREMLLSQTASDGIITINIFFVRISILALYHRIFNVYTSTLRLIYVGYVLCLLVALPNLGVVIGRMVKCNSWVTALTDPFCSTKSNSIAITTFAVTGVVVDCYIFMIAIHRVRSLRIERRKKVWLGIVFAIGLIACALSLAKLIFIAIHFSTRDQLWYALWVALCSILEANVALICSCATFLPAFWRSQNWISAVGSRLGIRPYDPSVPEPTVPHREYPLKAERTSNDALVAKPDMALSHM